MVEVYPGMNVPLLELFNLANASFEAEIFKDACLLIGPLDATTSDQSLWTFPLTSSGQPSLQVGVDPDRGQVACAILSVYWEDEEQGLRERGEPGGVEPSEIDKVYDQTLRTTVGLLGNPLLLGVELDQGYRHAIWRGRSGLLVLQQSNHDPQFGPEINYWITSWSGPDPRPTSPFIDWLMSLP